MYNIRRTELQILRIIRLKKLISFHRLKFHATHRRVIIGRTLEIKGVQFLLLTEKHVIKLSLSFENLYSQSNNLYVHTYVRTYFTKQVYINSLLISIFGLANENLILLSDCESFNPRLDITLLYYVICNDDKCDNTFR